MLRKIGYSDRVFQYKETRDLRIQMVLSQPLVLEKLRTAVNKAMADFPEYAVAPVRKAGQFYYEENHREVAFYPYDATERYFGTEETNYYMLYILYNENSFVLSFFHGLSDFKGMWCLIQNIVYYYALELGFSVPDISIKNPQLDDTERYDPYRKYQDRDSEAVLPEVKGEILRIPEKKLPPELHQQHEYTLSVSLEKFLALTRSWNASVTSALAVIISNTLAELYDAGEKEVVLKISADMRPYFKSETRVNFSEAIELASSKEFRELPIAEQCEKHRIMMKKQLTADNFKKVIAASVAKSRAMSGEIAEPDVKVNNHALTYVMTYPGKMDLPKEYRNIIKDFALKGYFPVDTIRFQIKTTEDELRIGIVQVFDTDKIIRSIADSLEKLGFETKVEDFGRFGGDRYDAERIKEVKM